MSYDASHLTIALSKGRILSEALPLLARIGIEPVDDPDASRRLILDTTRPDVRLVVVRAADVPTYVEYGAADVGVAGKDVLLEHVGDALYEPIDLGIARCQLVVAGRPDVEPDQRRVRVATKYVHTTRRHFAERGIQAEVIKLYGSMELAPLVGLAERIVDLVDTGNTLRANGLVVFDRIAVITARLIVNKAAMKLKHAAVRDLIARLSEQLTAPAAVMTDGAP